MAFDGTTHRRRSIRLKGYDYSQAGAYFITVCTQDRVCLFGYVVDGDMRLNGAGRMIQSVWDAMPTFYPGVETDEVVVMPNHIHGIIVLVGATPRGRPEAGQAPDAGQARGPAGQARGPAPTLALGEVVRRFKTMTTSRYANAVKQLAWPAFSGRLWQRNYYEHIIRDEESLNRIRRYILDNPARWAMDRENPEARAGEAEDASAP